MLANVERYDAALDALHRASAIGESPEVLGALAYVMAMAGPTDDARSHLESLQRLREERLVSPLLIAQALVGLAGHDAAFRCLDRALEERATDLIWLQVRPTFAPLWKDPRFSAMLDRLGLAAPDV